MNVLLDTNILIYREDSRIIDEEIQKLQKLVYEMNIRLFVHPMSVEDIKNDKDEKRKKIMLSKLRAYPILENPPKPDRDFINKIGAPKTRNDEIDSHILYAVYRSAVDYLITEDRGLHKKAKKVELSDRVMTVDEFLRFLENQKPKEYDHKLPSIVKKKMYELNLEDPFFDSLKEDYPDFEEWWEAKCREHRDAYCYFKENGKLGAILIWKIEEEPIVLKSDILPKKKRLKICTLKVDYRGYRLGERFIKMSIDYAVKNNIDEIYLTHFTKENDKLVELIENYGFCNIGKKQNNEDVFIKKLIPDDLPEISLRNPHKSAYEFSKKYYPSYYDGPLVKKFIVPIRPEYHERLFIEFERQPKITEFFGELIVEGNTIRKAYLCHAKIQKIKPGAILLFYRSKDKNAITTVGVVEDVYYDRKNPDEIMNIVKKRTVYSKEEIEEMTKNKPVTVILFNLHFYLRDPIKLDDLKNEGILKTAPQSIWELKHGDYVKIKELGGIDERYTFDKAKIR